MRSASLFAFILVLFSTSLFSCTEQQDMLSGPEDVLSHGNWSVDYFSDGQDQTARYGTYNFSFSANGSLTCNNTVHNCSGTWNVARNVQSDVLNLNLSSPQPELQELNNAWTISESSMQSITMSNGTEVLRLRKL